MSITLTFTFNSIKDASDFLIDAMPINQSAPAPGSADADLSQTAREDTQDNTLPAASAVFGQNAAPPAAATVAVVPLPASPAPGAELDAEGLPWDERIHSGAKSKIANGAWRAKKGVDDATIAAVKAELKRTMLLPVPTTAVSLAPPPVVTPEPPAAVATVEAAPPPVVTPEPPAVVATVEAAAPPPPPAVAATVEVAAPPPPLVQAAPAQPAATAEAAPTWTFPIFASKLAVRLAADKAGTEAMLSKSLARIGINSMPLLATRLDLIPAVAADIGLTLP